MIRVAAIQMNSTPDKAQNLATARRLFKEATEKCPYIIAFPETFNMLSGKSADIREEAETIRGLTVETLREWAAEYNVWILGGSIFLKSSKKDLVTNTSLLINPDGDIAARYDKIHLFDAEISGDKTAYRESNIVKAGKKPVMAQTPWGTVGLSICFDLRFPELYRAYAAKAARIIFVPAAFTETTGKAHWDILTRARAIENQAFVIAPAQTGSPYPGRNTYGHTRIVDPWGEVLAEHKTGSGVIVTELDFKRQDEIRRSLPVLTISHL
jgi:nitrilase